MNLLILLLFGILSISHGRRYRIPEHDLCVLRVLLCDDFTNPLTPTDNSTLEMFETIEELNTVCDGLTKFRACLKNAEIFCKENFELDVGFQLLNNRRLAFDLCENGSSHQLVYMAMEGCVNKYSHSVIEFCTDKAVEKVGLQFYLGDFDAECRFLGEIQHCHVAVVRDLCGIIAGNILEKLVVFRGERDFLCIGYEKERLSNIEPFYATMDSYVQQYKNIVNRLEVEGESETIDESKKYQTQESFVQDEVSSKFQSRISPLNDDEYAFGNIHLSDSKEPFNSEVFRHTEEQPLYSLSYQEIDSIAIPPKTSESRFSDHKYNFYDSENVKYPIDTEIHSISSEGNVEKELEVEDANISPNYDENLNPLNVEADNGKNLVESFTLVSSSPSKSSQHSYRPYEMYRPRLGEVLEVEDGSMWDEDLETKGATKGSSNLKTQSFKYSIEDYCSTRLNAKETCPVLQENISILVDKLVDYYRGNFISVTDPLDISELEKYGKFPICTKEKDALCSYEIWKFEDPESIIDHQPKQYEEIYVAIPSTEIEIHGVHNSTAYEDSEVPEVVEDSEVPEVVEDSEVPEVVEDSEDNYKVAYEEEISSKSENMFDRRSNKNYPTDLEEMLFNVFEVLAELKVNVMRMRKKLRETRMKENEEIKSLAKIEL